MAKVSARGHYPRKEDGDVSFAFSESEWESQHIYGDDIGHFGSRDLKLILNPVM